MSDGSKCWRYQSLRVPESWPSALRPGSGGNSRHACATGSTILTLIWSEGETSALRSADRVDCASLPFSLNSAFYQRIRAQLHPDRPVPVFLCLVSRRQNYRASLLVIVSYLGRSRRAIGVEHESFLPLGVQCLGISKPRRSRTASSSALEAPQSALALAGLEDEGAS